MNATRALSWTAVALLASSLVACKKDKKQSDETIHFSTPSDEEIAEDMREPEHVVLFALGYGGEALPLACWNDESGTLESQDDCLTLVPPASEKPELSFGHQTTTLGEERMVVCEPSGTETAGLATGMKSGRLLLGVWPEKARKKITIHLADPGAATTVSVESEEAARLQKVIQKKEPNAAVPPTVTQKLRLDIDGDGKKDTLYAVHIDSPAASAEERYIFAGLILFPGSAPDTGQILLGSRYELPRVVASMDLDDNEATELVIHSAYYEGEAITVEQYSAGQLKSVGGWGCGA